MLNIFCSMTTLKKMINCGDISKKLILGTFTSSSSFSNSSNLRVKISDMFFHCRTHGSWQGEGGVRRNLENGFRVLLRFGIQPWTRPWTKKFIHDKLAVSLAVLLSTESLKIVIITLVVPYKIIMLFSYHNVKEMRLKLEE